MLTSEDLTDQIEGLTVSVDARSAFARRVAKAFIEALEARAIVFHAVNDGFHAVGDGFDCIAKLSLQSGRDGWRWTVSDKLSFVATDTHSQIETVTTLSDSELARLAADWAHQVARVSKHVVFRNLYVPKAVEMADGYNDLRVAFRIVRAFDPVLSGYILRLDSVFKNLAA